jgi:hypothetical protein
MDNSHNRSEDFRIMAYEAKTAPSDASVEDYVRAAGARSAESQRLLQVFGRASGKKPKLWGQSIVGFGTYSYRYPSGHQGSSFLTGFAPRKTALTIYIMTGFDHYPDLMARLGKFTTGKSCLYVKRLSDVNEAALEELVARSVARMRELYPT